MEVAVTAVPYANPACGMCSACSDFAYRRPRRLRYEVVTKTAAVLGRHRAGLWVPRDPA